MQNQGLIVLIILNIIILVLIFVLSNFTHAQELYQKTLYDITKYTPKENAYINVGKHPRAIGVNIDTGKLYVVNYGDDSVSVIDGDNNTKIGKDIPVGRYPVAIGVNPVTNTIYVANPTDNNVSVIDGASNTNIRKDIHVGRYPHTYYVGIGVNPHTNTIYVANLGDSTVSVIDGKANKVVAKVIFNIEPFNAGHIECDKEELIAPVSEEFYMWPGTQCTAKPNQGFEFVSWQENLGGNSSRLMSLVSAPSIVDSILEFFHMNPDKPEATLNVTKFGSFTANFRAVPAPIPPEYVATLFTVVATAFIGTSLTPALIGWRKSRMQRKYFKGCISQIGKLDKDITPMDC